ncbi:MAG: type II/IV secretion system protein [Bacilli bacterium]|nr:type II/IV secretion system protein [Bacilli bacterium]
MFRQFDYDSKPIVEIVNEIITDAVKHDASDIHFDPYPDNLHIRIRIDGELIDYAIAPDSVKKNLLTRVKIMAGMNITETRLPQDGAIKQNINGIDLDLRVSSLPILDGEKVVIRILDYSMSTAGLENLGFSEENFQKINKIIHNPHGIILVAGATGSGKSTTVYAMLQKLNTPNRNVITVEDPVEMKIEGVNQVQTMSEIGLTFGNTLRSILRQDPDIIMIGEIRDDETARIAVRASITGHLVLSTIHTNNSLTTIERLTDMEVERYLLGAALTGIVSQRLCKSLCPHCRKLRPTTDYEKLLFKEVLKKDVNEIYEPVGCDKCIGGYKGRIAIHEVLIIDQEIRDGIIDNISKDELRHLVYNRDEGSADTLLYDGLQKVLNGYTSFEEILRIIDIDEDLGDEDESIKNALIGNKKSTVTHTNLEEAHSGKVDTSAFGAADENEIKLDEKEKEEAEKQINTPAVNNEQAINTVQKPTMTTPTIEPIKPTINVQPSIEPIQKPTMVTPSIEPVQKPVFTQTTQTTPTPSTPQIQKPTMPQNTSSSTINPYSFNTVPGPELETL